MKSPTRDAKHPAAMQCSGEAMQHMQGGEKIVSNLEFYPMVLSTQGPLASVIMTIEANVQTQGRPPRLFLTLIYSDVCRYLRPMITGHNCFGAILHTITLSDFMIADVTDAMVTGHIASFPGCKTQKSGFPEEQQIDNG